LDEPVEPGSGPQYGRDPEWRLSRVETDVSDLKATTSELKAIVGRIEGKLDAMLTQFATKADLATSESRLERKLSSLDVKLSAGQASLDSRLATLQATLDATLRHLATRAELADKPGKTYMWGILAALLTAYACGLAALAVLK
jgi:gamma-glutamyl:cysteine ligase YbdK (ATP-grasp superfamily)